MSDLTQRDAFWAKIYALARQNRNILVVTEDMGAPALDPFRVDLPAQFINVGIAEQQGLLLAAGLALEGKHPFVYAIAPFVTLRCLEQIRVANGIMNIPVTLVGVGAGFGYEDSGPTHHLIEDIAVLRAFPNITIHSISDSVMADAIAEQSCALKHTNYVRLDRQPAPTLYQPGADFTRGFAVLREGNAGWILATGLMTHTAVQVAERLARKGKRYGVIDVYALPTDETGLLKTIRGARQLVTMEEHFLPGGFGSYILEILNSRNLLIPVKRIGLPFEKGYCYTYGGRDRIHAYYGVDPDRVEAEIRKL